jgi:replicative DNA helicase
MTRAAVVAAGPPAVPVNLAAERAVLGAALLEPRPEVLALDPRCFHAEKHRRILAAMRAVAGRGEAVDSITVTAELERAGALEDAGGPAHLALLLEEAAVSTHTSEYVTELRALAARRVVLRRSHALAVAARNGADLGTLSSELEETTAEVAALASPRGRGANTTPPEAPPSWCG